MNDQLTNKLQEKLNQVNTDKKVLSDKDADAIAQQFATEEIQSSIEQKVTIEEQQPAATNAAPDVTDDIFNLDAIKQETEQMAQVLQSKQEEYTAGSEMKNVEESISIDDEVDAIINDIESSEASLEEDKETKALDRDMTPEELLRKYEESKVFANYTPNDEATGPAQYVVEVNDEYENLLTNIMENNNIKFDRVNGTEKNALLNRFTNSGTTVTVPLPNSGIYVKMSGAGVDELIAMSSIDGDSPLHQEIEKLSFIGNHIVDTSVGPLKLQELIGVVSYYDIPTLYYALFAATHPDEVEISRECPRCGDIYFMNVNTRDLLLNYKDFEKSNTDIRDNVLTYKQLLDKSQLAKVYRKAMSNGMIIYYKHPSIKSFLNTYNHMDKRTIDRFGNIAPLAFCIDKIAIKNTKKEGSHYVEYTDPNDIVLIISRLKNIDDKYEISETIEEIRPSANPNYGYHDATCPHCGARNKAEGIAIDTLLFTLARDEDTLAGLRSRARADAKKKART